MYSSISQVNMDILSIFNKLTLCKVVVEFPVLVVYSTSLVMEIDSNQRFQTYIYNYRLVNTMKESNMITILDWETAFSLQPLGKSLTVY